MHCEINHYGKEIGGWECKYFGINRHVINTQISKFVRKFVAAFDTNHGSHTLRTKCNALIRQRRGHIYDAVTIK